MSKNILILLSLLLFLITPAIGSAETEIPVPGMVTMVDLGADKCTPCKMMAPILTKLTKAYEGKAAIIFIDVWKDKAQGRKFKISAIPTQIFYNQKGKEVFRHFGFMSEKAIISQLQKMGVSPPGQDQ